ncbi:MAG TPA: ABC transporter substrate-binding protein [Ktedonobacteraceae bacterium]|nr:ABC transporter substrate-binding protein [Ktedonobacteraceae bacterium]
MRSYVISSRFLFSLVALFVLLLSGCGQIAGGSASTPTPGATPTAALPVLTQDAYGKPIVFPSTAPQHIVSLVPNISEILGALHLEGRVVGVDYYTNYPTNLTSLPKVSDANGKYNVEQIAALQPDLVLSYGQDTKQYDAQLQSVGENVVDLPAGNLTLTLQEILTVGRLTFTSATATTLVNQLQQQINQVKTAVAGATAPKVMIELDDSTPGKPYVFGGGSFGDELIQDANGVDIFHDNTTNGGFPQVTDEAVISANPQFIILTEDPAYGGDVNAVYKRPNWGGIDALKLRQVYRINPNLIGRAGPRLVEGLQCLAQIIHPAQFSGSLPAYCSGTV